MQLSNSLVPRSSASSGYLLRQHGGAAAAYSLQRLDTSTENVVRVRRSSDDAEADFTAEEVSGGALATYCGAGDGFVTTWYDQSGNGRNATQATAASQPQIVAAGVVVTDTDGNVAMEFLGSQSMSVSGVSISESTSFTVGDLQSATGDEAFYQIGTVNQVSSIFHTTATTKARRAGGTDVNWSGVSNQTVLYSVLAINDRLEAWKNGVSQGADETNVTLATATVITIGGLSASIYRLDGFTSELVIYGSDQSSSRSAIEANIASRYGITI